MSNELTNEEREGVKMIIALQNLAGIIETEERALAGWRLLSPNQRKVTKEFYEALILKNK